MNKFTLRMKFCLSLLICMVVMAFSSPLQFDEQASFLHKILNDHHDQGEKETGIKRFELNVTNSGFCRYKRFFVNGKVEYFSFNLVKFRDMDFYGTENKGSLCLRTKGEDVIVQTYNDRRNGDIDSMASCMSIPLKNIQPEDLIAISGSLAKMNAQPLAQK
jgi:hypothetical protein